MTTTAELIARVRAAADGTPYVVEERPYGFDLTIDIVDAKWWTLLRRNAVKRVFIHEVRLDEAERRMVITDAAHEVRWDAGVGASGRPSLHAERSVQRGRIHEFSREKQWGADPASGGSGSVVDYTFRAGEGRAIIRDASRPLGWTEGRGTEQKIGLAAALFALALIVVIGIVAGVLVVTGQ
jgi:hypothetical protein